MRREVGLSLLAFQQCLALAPGDAAATNLLKSCA
jgi:hypothetical protein